MSKRVLVVAAHPDDESLGMGGTWRLLQEVGWELAILWYTNGVSSRSDMQEDRNTRSDGVQAVLNILQPSRYWHFDYSDNRLDGYPLLDLIQPLEAVIDEFRPHTIFTHWQHDLNIDHRIVFQAVMTACRPVPDQVVKSIYSFEVLSSTEWSVSGQFCPNVYQDIGKHWPFKRRFMDCYRDELRAFPHSRSELSLESLATLRGSQVGVEKAEAFVLVRSTESLA
jgi:LmbE family N-acetylglucosaminyl deacetylase